jgi:DNA (cytosine-5)-methyltransferase 3A
MEVLSLFDGMSCGQIVLTDLGHKFKYYASEIDKFAIAQTQLNFPNTIQLGYIENWREWNIDWSKINLILAGSPCQGFSFAGKQLNFNDPRSKLFFVFVDILNHCKKFNPDVKFLLENVNMKKDYQYVINQTLGLFPVRINSNLVSAQNRDRLYWSNIKIKMVGLFNEIHTDIEKPENLGILLKDILHDESEVDRKYHISEKMIKWLNDHAKKEIKFSNTR